MALTQSQRAIIEKARSLGGGKQGVALDGAACAFLVATIAHDLGLLDQFPEWPRGLPPLFAPGPVDQLRLPGQDFLDMFERLVALAPDADTYFACLAALHKSRLKYERILQGQPVPTIDQVGPRGLLQYGTVSARALAGFLFWRKWMYDIDNRAAQETGYLFEPIIAHAVGGASASAKRSPIRRQADPRSGRQVDCIRGERAYEIKLRITIAASGQGRWQEELSFPLDCRASGYTPVLLVLDPTPSPKLEELARAFVASGGEVHVGEAAWSHLEEMAGKTMGRFLRKYVREPIRLLLEGAPDGEELPELVLSITRTEFVATLYGEKLTVRRHPQRGKAGEIESLPEDADEQIPGP
ncbi:MAG: hypothetical protein HY690_07335 [Chloroflexi bacterium]|nr:hypothetical protein [Chloroflexota bacterium]